MKNKKDTLNEFYRLSGVKPLIKEAEDYDIETGRIINTLKGLNAKYMYQAGKPIVSKITSVDVGENEGKEFLNIAFESGDGMAINDGNYVSWGQQKHTGIKPHDFQFQKRTILDKNFYDKLQPILSKLNITPKGLESAGESGDIKHREEEHANKEANILKLFNSKLQKLGTNWKFSDDKAGNTDSGKGQWRLVSSEGNKLYINRAADFITARYGYNEYYEEGGKEKLKEIQNNKGTWYQSLKDIWKEIWGQEVNNVDFEIKQA